MLKQETLKSRLEMYIISFAQAQSLTRRRRRASRRVQSHRGRLAAHPAQSKQLVQSDAASQFRPCFDNWRDRFDQTAFVKRACGSGESPPPNLLSPFAGLISFKLEKDSAMHRITKRFPGYLKRVPKVSKGFRSILKDFQRFSVHFERFPKVSSAF